MELKRLFPNMQAFVPADVEEEPTSDVDDDVADEDPEYQQPQARARVEEEHTRAAGMAAALAVPAQRPRRGAAAAANAAMDRLHALGELQ